MIDEDVAAEGDDAVSPPIGDEWNVPYQFANKEYGCCARYGGEEEYGVGRKDAVEAQVEQCVGIQVGQCAEDGHGEQRAAQSCQFAVRFEQVEATDERAYIVEYGSTHGCIQVEW